MSLNASRHLSDHMTGEVNRSTCWWRDYEWRRELWGWRGGRSRSGGRGGDGGGREGWRGWKISVSCPRVGEFFACRLGNTEGWLERGLEERGRAVNSSHWRWKRDSRGWPSESLSVGIDAESWKQKIPKETLDSRYRWSLVLWNRHKESEAFHLD